MIFFVLLFGLILRLISINQSLWLDEATSALTTRMSLADFFGKFMPGDFHPPLYYLTLRIWSMFFGTSEVGLRSLSILFGIVTIYMVYLIGKELIGKRTGTVAALLLATSGLHIYYSAEARMYAMSTFLVSVLIYFFIKTFHKGRVGDWFMFSITLGLIGLIDYLPLLVLIPIWMYVIFNKQNKNYLSKFIMSHIILVIFAICWFPIFIKQLTSGINVTNTSPSWVSVLGTFSIKDILLIPVKFVIGRVSVENKFIYGGIIGVVFLVFGFLLLRSIKLIKSVKNLQLIYLWLTIPILTALLLSIKIPVLNYFRFLFVLPAFYLIVAFGVNSLKKSTKALFLVFIIAINLITSFMYLTNIKFQREDWRSAVSFIENNKSIGSVVIFPSDSQMEAYRYYSPYAKIYGPEAINGGYSSVWLMRYAQPISDPNDTTRLRIERFGYLKVNEYDFNGVTVWKYTSR